jgi:hypothetical protein
MEDKPGSLLIVIIFMILMAAPPLLKTLARYTLSTKKDTAPFPEAEAPHEENHPGRPSPGMDAPHLTQRTEADYKPITPRWF